MFVNDDLEGVCSVCITYDAFSYRLCIKQQPLPLTRYAMNTMLD